jgi:hypothetical protein
MGSVAERPAIPRPAAPGPAGPSAELIPPERFGHGLTNPRGAEIHLILQDHGPGLVANQLSPVRGGCTDASLPSLYPPVAFADGIPGPNTCRLRQFAVLQQ